MCGSRDWMDSHWITLLKTLSWRATATITTVIIAYAVLGDITPAITIGAVEVVVKMIVFYAHERIWNNISKRS